MGVIAEVIVILVLLGTAYAFLAPAVNRRRVRTAGEVSEVESAEAHRNHLSMARWIDLQLKDDLVRSSVPVEEQARAKRLLDQFYGEDR